VLTTELGLVEQTPPEAIGHQRARGAAFGTDHLPYGLVLSATRGSSRT
jgi:hypothetical protein